MLALFRIVEPEAGSVLQIDGVDVLTIGLEVMHHSLSCLPCDSE
jgi:ABC-type multidrug transport system fused ATPase/permease subunit